MQSNGPTIECWCTAPTSELEVSMGHLQIALPESLHEDIRVGAARRNISIRSFCTRLLVYGLKAEGDRSPSADLVGDPVVRHVEVASSEPESSV